MASPPEARHLYGVWFRCLKHREFGVSDTALKTRNDAEPEQWERALKKGD